MLDKNEEDSTESTVFETGAMFRLQCQDKLEELVEELELELEELVQAARKQSDLSEMGLASLSFSLADWPTFHCANSFKKL